MGYKKYKVLISIFLCVLVVVAGLTYFFNNQNANINSDTASSSNSTIAPVVVDQATKNRIVSELQKTNASSTISEKEKGNVINKIQEENRAMASGSVIDEKTKQNIIKSLDPNYQR